MIRAFMVNKFTKSIVWLNIVSGLGVNESPFMVKWTMTQRSSKPKPFKWQCTFLLQKYTDSFHKAHGTKCIASHMRRKMTFAKSSDSAPQIPANDEYKFKSIEIKHICVKNEHKFVRCAKHSWERCSFYLPDNFDSSI